MIDGVLSRLRASGPFWLAARVARRALHAAGVEWTRVRLFRMTRRPPAPAHEVERITHPADPRLPEADPLVDVELAVERLLGGDELFLLRAPDGAVACCGWLRAGRPILVTEVDEVLPLGEGDAWIFDCETAPAHRGRGLFPSLLAAAAREHLGGGRVVRIGALDWNRASLRAIRRAGFSPDRVLARARVLGRTVL